MPYTPSQIKEYALALESKGASADEIESFVASAAKEIQSEPEQLRPDGYAHGPFTKEGFIERIKDMPRKLSIPALGFGETPGVFGTIPSIPDISQTAPALAPLAGQVNALGEVASSFTTPQNVAIASAVGPLARLAKDGNHAAQTALTGISALFSGQMAQGAAEQAGEASVELGRNDVSAQKKSELLARPILTGAMAAAPVAGVLNHGIKARQELSKIPQIETVKRNQNLGQINQGANEIALEPGETVLPPQPNITQGLDVPLGAMEMDAAGKARYRYGPSGLRKIEEPGTARALVEQKAEKKFADLLAEVEEGARKENIGRLGLSAEESAKAMLAAEKAKEDAAAPKNYAGAKLDPEKVTLGELVGQKVNYSGYEGTLIREGDGTISLLRPVTTDGTPNLVEIADSGKNLDTLAKDVGVGFGEMDARSVTKGRETAIPAISEQEVTPASTNTPPDKTNPVKTQGTVVPANGAGPVGFKAGGGYTSMPLVEGGVGGLIGSQIGDTEEERKENAKRGFLMGLGLGGLVKIAFSAKPGLLNMTAFHGTPHKVDKFKTEKIGTGEGSQVYGHGLYFAENRKVGEGYRKALAGEDLIRLTDKRNGDIVYEGTDPTEATNVFHTYFKSKGEKVDIEHLKSESISQGHLYEVNLDVKPDELLIWDKPLSEQPTMVQEILSGVGRELESPFSFEDTFTGSDSGETLYKALGEKLALEAGYSRHGPEAPRLASEFLNQAGIKGIKYADQGSRNPMAQIERTNGGQFKVADPRKGYLEGSEVFPTREEAVAYRDQINKEIEQNATHNFVVFDDSRIKILKENDKPVGNGFIGDRQTGAALRPGEIVKAASDRAKTILDDFNDRLIGRMAKVEGERSAEKPWTPETPIPGAFTRKDKLTRGEDGSLVPISGQSSVPPQEVSGGREPWSPLVSNSKIGSILKKATIASDNIKAVHPQVAGRVREMALREASLSTDMADRAVPGLTDLRKLVGKEEFEQIGIDLRNYKEAEVFNRLEEEYGDRGKEVVGKLKEGWLKVRDEAIEAIHRARGTKVEKLENYWPLRIADAEGLVRVLEKDDPSILRKALESAEEAKGEPLTAEEKNAAIADLIQGSMAFPGKPGFIKQRTIEALRHKWSQYFEPIDVSVQDYISQVARDVSQREFLGKVDQNAADPWSHNNPESSGPIGSLIAELIEKGEITDEGADVIKENINAILNQPKGSKAEWAVNRSVGAVQVAANLGQIANAISQMGDAGLTAFLRRPDDAIKGFTKAILKLPDRVKLEDISLHEGNPEVKEFSRNSGKLNKLVSLTLKPFFSWADRVGKEGFLNATEIWASRNAKSENPAFKFEKTARETAEMFPEDWPQMLEAMKDGDWLKPELKKFLFNELSNIQPTTKAEMPLGQLQASPLGKIPWRLMSFTLRQLGLVRTNAYEAAKQGRKAEAASWLAQYAFWMVVTNSMVQYARDTVDLKKTSDIKDYAFGALMQMIGVNRVAATSIAKGDIAQAVGERVIPGIPSLVMGGAKDIGTARDELRAMAHGKPLGAALESGFKKSELLRNVPTIGRPLYTMVGAGHTKEVKAQAHPKPTMTQEVGEIFWPALGKKK